MKKEKNGKQKPGVLFVSRIEYCVSREENRSQESGVRIQNIVREEHGIIISVIARVIRRSNLKPRLPRSDKSELAMT